MAYDRPTVAERNALIAASETFRLQLIAAETELLRAQQEIADMRSAAIELESDCDYAERQNDNLYRKFCDATDELRQANARIALLEGNMNSVVDALVAERTRATEFVSALLA